MLEDLASSGHKFLSEVLGMEQDSSLKTYTDALQDHIDSKTKRVHTSFLLAATNTGRLASSDPNYKIFLLKLQMGRK